MELPIPPWVNVILRYCPNCRNTYPPSVERCPRCGEMLIDRVEREEVEEQ